jgi:acyl-coenzyme A thioesterase PaaI-like protein
LLKLQPNSRHCFVCGVENKFGLHLKFYETAPGEVTIETEVPDHFQGYPGVVHGGIVASLVDEALGRAHMGSDPKNPRFMFTAKLTVQYRKNVPTETPIRVVAHAVNSKKRTATSVAKIFGPNDELLVEADAVLVNVPPEAIESVDLESLGWKVYQDQEEVP